MTTTDNHEQLLVESAIHQEGTQGYIDEKLGRIAIIEARAIEIRELRTSLAIELGRLSNEAWGYYSDIAVARGK